MKLPSQLFRSLGVVLALSLPILCQEQAPPATGGGAPGGGGGGGGAPAAGPTDPGGGSPGSIPGSRPPTQQSPFPNDPRQQQQRFPEMQRPIFLSGKVVMEDGTPPPEPVTIERICNGQPRPEGYTDSKGRFSFQLGQNQHMLSDASVSNTADTFGGIGGPNNQSSMGGGFPGGAGGGIRERDLMGCEVRASLPGFRSEVVNLAGRRSMDNPDVGTIILRRLANVEGLTTSATALAAPKDAKKAFEKGRDQARKNKLADAEKELTKAVMIYPKYANAWADLGKVQELQNKGEAARESYAKALEADSKLVPPYIALALMYAKENKWPECAEYSGKAIKLNPFDYGEAYFYNAVANLNTQNLDEAEKSAREGIKTEKGKKIAKMHHVLGIVLAQKNDTDGALEHMKGYLHMLPEDAPDVKVVKGQIEQLEKFAQAQQQQQAKPAGAAAQQQQE
jgi:tetratricopeptide (TPR) repeat protein